MKVNSQTYGRASSVTAQTPCHLPQRGRLNKENKKNPKLSKKQLLLEAEQQKQALKRLGLWMKIAMMLSACGIVIAWWGFTGTGVAHTVIGVIGALLTVICLICAAVIGLGIRNGTRNVNHILNAVGVK